MNKARNRIAGGLVVLALWTFPTSVSAVDVEVGADVLSSYIWRGITVSRDPVIQPSATLEHRSGLALGVWGNYNLGSNRGMYSKNEFSEVDFDASYSFKACCVTRVTIGYIEHVYPGGTEDVLDDEDEIVGIRGKNADRDIYVRAAREVIQGLDLSVTWTRDLSNSDNAYTEISAVYGLQFVQGLVVSLVGSIAYGSREVTEATLKSGMHSYQIGLRTDIQSSEYLSLQAYAALLDSLDSRVLPSSAMRRKAVAGIGIFYAF